MEAVDAIAVLGAGYLAASFVVHRRRLARLRRDGLELSLLRRVDATGLPDSARPALDAITHAEVARVQGDAGAVERHARSAQAAIRGAGGARSSAGLAYLDAHVRLAYLTSAANLELSCWLVRAALRRALKKFGPQPSLYFALAHAQALLGQTQGALDALGRAVYYANGAAFYTDLVLASEFVERTRPRLRQEALARKGD